MPRTGGALTVKSDERSAVGRGPASRSSNDGALGDRLGGELPADAAQVIAVEQIGLAVLPKREDQSLGASTTGRLERKRVGAAEIGIAGIERLPIRWSEEILRLARPPQVRRQAYYRLAVTNSDFPSLLIPPGAQMPPPRARVAHDRSARGSESEMPTTNP